MAAVWLAATLLASALAITAGIAIKGKKSRS